jgi:hypothetical protein
MALFYAVLSIGVAYAIKAAWMHADQTHAHLQPPPPPKGPPVGAPPLSSNGTSTGNATTTTPSPSTWGKFGAWDRWYYMPALGVSLLLVGVVLVFLRCIIGMARGCCRRPCHVCCSRSNEHDRYRTLDLSVETPPVVRE